VVVSEEGDEEFGLRMCCLREVTQHDGYEAAGGSREVGIMLWRVLIVRNLSLGDAEMHDEVNMKFALS